MTTWKVPTRLLVLALSISLLSAGTAFAHHDKAESGKGKGKHAAQAAKPRAHGGKDTYFHRHGHAKLTIPKGHYPPPGACRIWYPGRPPGQQPPPGNCALLKKRVPAGAWLIRHPEDTPDHVQVVVYEDRRPGTILAIGEFSIGSGTFVRVVVDG